MRAKTHRERHFVILSAVAILFQLSASVPAAKPSEVAALVARARDARLQQDSLLAGYEAIARQRLSAGIGRACLRGAGPMAGALRPRTHEGVQTQSDGFAGTHDMHFLSAGSA